LARTLIAIAFAALAVFTAAACGGGGGSDESGPVRFLVFGDPEELKAFRAVATAYEREHDGDIQLVEASDREDLIARLSTSLAAGSPPDVFLMNYRFYGQFAAKDAIDPIQDRLRDSDLIQPDDFYPQAMTAFQWGGKQLCLPQNISSLVVYYNRDLFRRAGLPEPEPGWTWNHMVGTARRLTMDAAGNSIVAGEPDQGGVKAAVYGLGIEPTIIRIAPFVWSNGGRLVDDELRPTRLTLSEPKSLTALQLFLDLRTVQGVIPSDVEVEAEDDETRFANGGLAMLLSSRRSTPTFRTIKDFDWDVAPLPQHMQAAGILHSDAYCITAASDRKDAAWEFVEFANGPEGQRIVARTGRTVPSLISVSRSDAFLDPDAKPRHSQVFLDGIPNIRRVPTISTWPEIEDAAEGILENGLYLGQPAYEVAARLERVTGPMFERGLRDE
jgi:multiple sugar transport system substrate-binding protein